MADLEALRAEYHLSPPAPYDEHLRLDNIAPTREAFAAIRQEIEDDASLSPEQKAILEHELFDRWRAVVISEAGEGFYD